MDINEPNQWSRFAIALAVTVVVLIGALFAGIFDARANTAESSSLYQTPDINFKQNEYTVEEGQTAVIEVVIQPGPTVTETVSYLTTDGTAQGGVDYDPVSGILSFTSITTTVSFEVRTEDNFVADGDRTVNLVLTNPSSGATLIPDPTTAVLIIEDNEPTPTATKTGATATPVFVDIYEPNNTIGTAYETSVGAELCGATLWPVGDIDWYRFVLKKNRPYQIQTSDLSAGLDTILSVYDPSGNFITSNDDFEFGSLASRVTITAGQDGFYFAKIQNKSTSDPANKTYCFDVTEVQATATPTPLPTGTRVPGADICEYNGDFDFACLIGAGDEMDMNFVPIWGEGPDNDYYRIWVKPGLAYTCETFDLSSVNDTNMILYDQHRNGLAGNDDKELGDFGSRVTWVPNYTGWLFILVGPVAPPSYEDSFLYTYSLQCVETIATPTPLPTPTRPLYTGPPVVQPATATPTVTPTPPLTVTAPIAVATVPTVTPTPTPNVVIVPLPTAEPPVSAGNTVDFDLTVYFDANENFTPELTEGVEDVAVAVYDNTTSELLAFGYTNEAGVIRFSSLVVSGAVRVSIPYLQFNQVGTGTSNVFIRVAPFLLPADTS
ncbi:MAG: pre-peptidase C-terminal domain-containing protein [Chloroflexota bacterium]|nr:MAG: pre-peptidase C-terminal domain-containing protein [Chloroflexota bacterium]